ncbi:MAG: GNAT family N-acetyltransferase [Verrucomicrobiota bacterium]
MQVLRTGEASQWMAVMERCSAYDIGHLPAYHLVAERNGEGEASLFVYERLGHTIALPLLLRPLGSFGGALTAGCKDATSVYGYAGPVFSGVDIPKSVLDDFRLALCATLRRERVISVFSRLHPLFDQRPILSGLGECLQAGQTVSIDLTLPEEQQRAHYRRDLRKGIVKLQEAGAICRRDPEKRSMGVFVEMYRDTMCRVGAENYYVFDDRYFENLLSGLGPNLDLFICSMGDVQIGSLLVSTCCGIAQAYLSASAGEYMKWAPTKLVFDTVRGWATQCGFKVLHLGGGVGGKSDSLFHFKSGFSDRRHEFLTWRWIIEPETYEKVCAAKTRWNLQHRLTHASSDYFPRYRSPSIPHLGECPESNRSGPEADATV